MKLESPVFDNNQPYPTIYTQDGDNISPPLHWSNAPAGTKCFVLIMENSEDYSTHWLLYNLPSMMTALDREVPDGGHYGSQAFQGVNDFGTVGYCGPEMSDDPSSFIFRLYAMDSELPLKEGCSKAELLSAMEGHIMAQADLKTSYSRKAPGQFAMELRLERQHKDAYDLSAQNNKIQPEDARYDQSDEKLPIKKRG